MCCFFEKIVTILKPELLITKVELITKKYVLDSTLIRSFLIVFRFNSRLYLLVLITTLHFSNRTDRTK